MLSLEQCLSMLMTLQYICINFNLTQKKDLKIKTTKQSKDQKAVKNCGGACLSILHEELLCNLYSTIY